MFDPVKVEAAEKSLDAFIDSQAKRLGEDKANLLEQRFKENDRKRLAATREENRILWARYLRKTASAHLALARSARARARQLENGHTSA